MISNRPRFIKELYADVKCTICGSEFNLRNSPRRRCPGCGCRESWVSLGD